MVPVVGRSVRLWLVGTGVLLGLAGAVQARAAEAILIADAHVNSAMPAVNSGTISNLNVGGGYTTLLQFDLSLLPVGTNSAKVSRAVLRLYANRVTTPGLVTLAPVTASWGEYSVTFASLPQTGSAADLFQVDQAGAFIAVDVTALVQGWIASPTTNNGIALSAGTAVLQFDSKENDQTAHAATLSIELVDAGPMGPAGPAGANGIQGPQGIAGLQGPVGTMGATGPAGQTGLTGATGSAGPQGPQGATGPTGPQGPAGPAGAGAFAYKGNYSSIQNYALGDVVLWQGSSYTSLIAGNHGNTPATSPLQWGVLAQQGLTGTAGAAGPAGSQGPQGLPGSMGAVGPPGPQGLQGIAGEARRTGNSGYNWGDRFAGADGPARRSRASWNHVRRALFVNDKLRAGRWSRIQGSGIRLSGCRESRQYARAESGTVGSLRRRGCNRSGRLNWRYRGYRNNWSTRSPGNSRGDWGNWSHRPPGAAGRQLPGQLPILSKLCAQRCVELAGIDIHLAALPKQRQYPLAQPHGVGGARCARCARCRWSVRASRSPGAYRPGRSQRSRRTARPASHIYWRLARRKSVFRRRYRSVWRIELHRTFPKCRTTA